jgi:hypothetical protein
VSIGKAKKKMSSVSDKRRKDMEGCIYEGGNGERERGREGERKRGGG